MQTLRQRSFSQWAMEAELIVRIYESRLWRRSALMRLVLGLPFEREYELILGAAELAEAGTVLDLACGPGIYSRPFARALPRGRVVGLDLSPPMLRHAQRRAREEQLANLSFVRGDAQQLPLPDSRFDLVNCCGALHLFRNPVRALAEAQRVLRPGGHITLAAVRRNEGRLDGIANRWRRRWLGLDSFTAAELTGRMRAAGFDDVRLHHARRAWLVASGRKTVSTPIGSPVGSSPGWDVS